MKQLSWFALAGLSLAAISSIAGADARAPEDPEKPRARARLIAEHTALTPGSTAYLGVSFDIDPGWHIYWDGAGDTGMPVQVEAELPPGVRAGELLWPAPKRYTSPGDLLDYIYEDRVTLLLPLTVPPDAKPGESLRITAQLDWLECLDICLPGSAQVELTLPVTSPDQPAPKSADAARFDEARQRLPKPLAAADMAEAGIQTSWSGPRLSIRADGASSLAFYPKTESLRPVEPLREGAAKGDTLSIEFEGRSGEQTRVVGVLEVSREGERGRKPDIYAIDLPGPAAR